MWLVEVCKEGVNRDEPTAMYSGDHVHECE